MKKTLAAVALAAALALPFTAEAHRGWIAPSQTVFSGAEAWVGFDAAMSNGVFLADHAAMRLDGLTVLRPDGSAAEAQNLSRGRLRYTFDVHLTQQGTWKVANVLDFVIVSYTLNGETQRWRGTPAEYPAALPEGATDIQATHSQMRVETFVTLGEPTDAVFAPTGSGIEMVPVTHPTDLVVGEAATFRLLRDGRPHANQTVTLARGGGRYRDNPEEITLTTGADGAFTVTWTEAGMYWINSAVREDAVNGGPARVAQYNGVVEILP